MTDKLHKNTESCTESNTPETDANDEAWAYNMQYDTFSSLMDAPLPWDEFARKLERERDEWKEVAEGSLLGAIKERDEALFDLDFRRDLFKLQESQLNEIRKQLAEARNACQIWQSGHSALVRERHQWQAEAERWRQICESWRQAFAQN
jgi:hypothetical protein